MPTLPWIPVESATAPAVVMASRFRLRRLRDVPRSFLDAMRIHKQVRAADGRSACRSSRTRCSGSSSP
jgi:hypothetical protein